jgi:hypothetical protein
MHYAIHNSRRKGFYLNAVVIMGRTKHSARRNNCPSREVCDYVNVWEEEQCNPNIPTVETDFPPIYGEFIAPSNLGQNTSVFLGREQIVEKEEYDRVRIEGIFNFNIQHS